MRLLLLLMLLALQAVRVGVIKLGSTVDAGVRLVLVLGLVVRMMLLLAVLIVCGISRTSVARTRQTIFYRGLRLVGLEQPH